MGLANADLISRNFYLELETIINSNSRVTECYRTLPNLETLAAME